MSTLASPVQTFHVAVGQVDGKPALPTGPSGAPHRPGPCAHSALPQMQEIMLILPWTCPIPWGRSSVVTLPRDQDEAGWWAGHRPQHPTEQPSVICLPCVSAAAALPFCSPTPLPSFRGDLSAGAFGDCHATWRQGPHPGTAAAGPRSESHPTACPCAPSTTVRGRLPGPCPRGVGGGRGAGRGVWYRRRIAAAQELGGRVALWHGGFSTRSTPGTWAVSRKRASPRGGSSVWPRTIPKLRGCLRAAQPAA